MLPAYNEADVIGRLIHDMKELNLSDAAITVMVVDDGSTDQTTALASPAGAVVLSHKLNTGVGAAFQSGLQWVREKNFDLLLHLDADDQIPVSAIPKLLSPVFRNKFDMTIGSRFLHDFPKGRPAWRALS